MVDQVVKKTVKREERDKRKAANKQGKQQSGNKGNSFVQKGASGSFYSRGFRKKHF